MAHAVMACMVMGYIGMASIFVVDCRFVLSVGVVSDRFRLIERSKPMDNPCVLAREVPAA